MVDDIHELGFCYAWACGRCLLEIYSYVRELLFDEPTRINNCVMPAKSIQKNVVLVPSLARSVGIWQIFFTIHEQP